MSCSFPRPATPVETQALSSWYERIYQCDDMFPDQIMVTEDYITGGPCYMGQLWIAIWDGAPEFVDVFTLEMEWKCKVCGELEWRHPGSDRHIDAGFDLDHAFEKEYVQLVDRFRRVLCGARGETGEDLNPDPAPAQIPPESVVAPDPDEMQDCVKCGRSISYEEYVEEEMDICHACLCPICPTCDVDMMNDRQWACPSCGHDTRDPHIIPGADDGEMVQ